MTNPMTTPASAKKVASQIVIHWRETRPRDSAAADTQLEQAIASALATRDAHIKRLAAFASAVVEVEGESDLFSALLESGDPKEVGNYHRLKQLATDAAGSLEYAKGLSK